MKEFLERLRFAWQIITTKDPGLVHHVRREILLVDPEVEENAVNVARAFCLEGHSGGSAPIMISWLAKLLSWNIVAPLTGEDHEWGEVGDGLFQNRRCSRVFKMDGHAWDIDGFVFVDPDGSQYTSQPKSRRVVTFPYHPLTEYVNVSDNGDHA